MFTHQTSRGLGEGGSRYRNHRYITRKHTKDLSSNRWDKGQFKFLYIYYISNLAKRSTMNTHYFYNYENSNAGFFLSQLTLAWSSPFVSFLSESMPLWGRLRATSPRKVSRVRGHRVARGSWTCKGWGTSCTCSPKARPEPSPGPQGLTTTATHPPYGCERGTIKEAERRRIDAFQLWCRRRLLRVPWTARRSTS